MEKEKFKYISIIGHPVGFSKMLKNSKQIWRDKTQTPYSEYWQIW